MNLSATLWVVHKCAHTFRLGALLATGSLEGPPKFEVVITFSVKQGRLGVVFLQVMAQKGEYSHDRRDETATPLCGAHRPLAVTKNALLVQPQLGCVRKTVYDLPSKGNLQHEYGLRQERDGSNSADVLGNWAQFEGTGNKLPGRDFRALNKKAAMEGKCTTTDIREFRMSNDIRLKLGDEKKTVSHPWDDSTVFGRATGAAEPFVDLVSHQHRFAWVNNQPPQSELLAAVARKKPQPTKTSRLMAETARKKLAEEAPKEMWKLPTYKNVPAKIGQTG